MRNNLVLGALALSAAALIAGCFGHAGARAEVDAPLVFVEEPTLVVVEPNVWVVRDYDYAVYYVDDYYWVYRDDVWHRSRMYDRGWARVEVNIVPTVIVRRDHRTYVHYRGSPSAQTRKAPRKDRDDRDRRADDHRDVPPARDKDREPRPPEHADDRHTAPPRRDREDARQPPDHSGDRDAPPHHDGQPRVSPSHEDQGGRDNIKPAEHDKRDGKGKPDQHDHKRDDKKDRHDKK
jgi:hypothetical protein